tara:strand:+ start:11592 stop:12659 length:1068 start_codon:yes stop_codon:yes gene_type:complete
VIESTRPAAPDALEHFFFQVTEAFGQAAGQGPLLTQQRRLAGRTLRLEFAGPAMQACVVPALDHLPRVPDAVPDLRVCIFDSASTGVALPAAPWGDDAQVARGEILGLESSQTVRVTLQPGSAVLTLYHPSSATALMWIADARDCPYWEAAAPLRGLLHWWCAAHGLQLVHAAAIGTADGALLLTGKGGSGKSTTALSALVGGLRYLGDDYVVCENGAAGPAVHSLYNTAKVGSDSLAMLPSLTASGTLSPGEGQDKAVLYTACGYRAQLSPTLPLRAILVPRITGGAPALLPLTAGAAFLALAPTTLFQLPGAGRATTAFLRELVTSLPCYQLALGPDMQALVALLKDSVAAGR